MTATTRKANLSKLLDARFGGHIADLARALEKDDAYIWQLLNGKRNIGERAAREFEGKLSLAPGSMDSPTMAAQPVLTPDEWELIERYRRAPDSRKLVLRLVASTEEDLSEDASRDVNALLAKISAGAGRRGSYMLNEPIPTKYRKS